MRTIPLILTLLISVSTVYAQTDTTYWNTGGNIGINFNQSTLSNWSAGGTSSVSGTGVMFLLADYAKSRVYWNNSLDLGYGLLKEEGQGTRKTEDKIVLVSNYGAQLSPQNDKWFFSALLDFRTQFTDGFSTDNPDSVISKFAAPAYLLTSIGLDYKPFSFLSFKFGLVSSKMTFVNDQTLADRGAFGVDEGKMFRGEFGGTFAANFNKEIFENTTFTSNLVLFSNYVENPDKIDVNWENTLVMKINSFLTANLYNQLIYDYDIKFDVTDEQGNVVQEERVQFKNILGLGISYKFGGQRG
ncbi:DUF3078 domain-containing protein [Reichenbachiella versicolor]|uniref:DUF3078 domain-containing protein n=1 Tax=Reichenbachiella versicolor TaxID=1821036 RepID=UPI000D6E7654|nr:DUF3078 domain-containing protein [Reichenbachiella versicolor]